MRFRVDTSPPSVQISAPAPGLPVNLLLRNKVVATADDVGCGLARVEFFLGDERGRRLGSRAYHPYEVDLTRLTLGTQRLLAVAIDRAGNTARHAVEVQVVETSPPLPRR